MIVNQECASEATPVQLSSNGTKLSVGRENPQESLLAHGAVTVAKIIVLRSGRMRKWMVKEPAAVDRHRQHLKSTDV